MRFFLILCFAAFSFVSAPAQERYVKPVDEAKKDASFLAFRTELIEAVKKRDAKYVLSILDQNIMNNYGGGSGVEEFKETWKISSLQSRLWSELLIVLTNGGTFSEEAGSKFFSAPYTFSRLPSRLDAFEYQMIFGNNVNLREKPDLQAKTVARLSYNIVKIDYENSLRTKNNEDRYDWLKVETMGGKKGFVKAEFVRGAFDYRAIFEKKRGQWKMTAFIAGD